MTLPITLALLTLAAPRAAPAPDSLVVDGRDASWSGVLPAGAVLEVQNAVGEILVEPTDSDRAEVTAERYGEAWEDVRFELATGPDGSVSICALARDNAWLRQYPNRAGGRSVGCALGGGGLRLGGIGRDDREVGVSFTVRVPPGVAFRARTYDADVESSVPGTFRTSDGDVFLDLSGSDRQQDVDVQTVDGDVMVRLAPGIGRDIDAASREGRVRTDLPVPRVGRQAVVGRVWGGGPALRVRTGDGTIRLREAR